jgi:hypothetical protein
MSVLPEQSFDSQTKIDVVTARACKKGRALRWVFPF